MHWEVIVNDAPGRLSIDIAVGDQDVDTHSVSAPSAPCNERFPLRGFVFDVRTGRLEEVDA